MGASTACLTIAMVKLLMLTKAEGLPMIIVHDFCKTAIMHACMAHII